MMVAVIDYKKKLKHLYHSSTREVVVADAPGMNFLMVDGSGDPNTSQEFQHAVEALFSLSYTLKFMIKKRGGQEYSVMPLEGLWWVENMAEFSIDNKDHWQWTAMIMQPEFVTGEYLNASIEEVRRKKNPPALDKIRFECYDEGLSAQIMHVGPFSAEGPTVEKLHAFIKENGYQFNGKHHEIYLSDFRRVDPDRMKTIIRQPIKIME